MAEQSIGSVLSSYAFSAQPSFHPAVHFLRHTTGEAARPDQREYRRRISQDVWAPLLPRFAGDMDHLSGVPLRTTRSTPDSRTQLGPGDELVSQSAGANRVADVRENVVPKGPPSPSKRVSQRKPEGHVCFPVTVRKAPRGTACCSGVVSGPALGDESPVGMPTSTPALRRTGLPTKPVQAPSWKAPTPEHR